MASRITAGPALVCAVLGAMEDLPAAPAERLDALVWCVHLGALAADHLRRAATAIRPRRIVVLIVPAGFLAGDPACADPPPPLGGVRAALTTAITPLSLALASAGWSGEPMDEALQALSSCLLYDLPGGECRR